MEEETIKETNLEASGTFLASNSTPYGSFHKIFRKGVEIHEVNENITMVKPSENSNFTELVDKLENTPSGESLFKTFAFNQGISKDETEKCLSFWRSVVERNLEPIKCTLIENITTKPEGKLKKGVSKKKRDKTTLLPPEKTSNVWLELIQELQEKKLHETKLLMEKRCRFCDYLNSGYVSEDPSKETQEMINELSTWKPQSNKLKKSTLQNKEKRSSLSTGKSVQSAENQEKSRELEGKSLNQQNLLDIKREADKIKYVDVVEMKKQNGDYTKWRDSYLTDPCKCQHDQCDCNTNGNGTQTVPVNSLADSSTENSFEPDEIARPSTLIPPDKSISLILHCVCQSSNCDCGKLVTVPEKPAIIDAVELPRVEPTVIPHKVDSLELVKKRMSSRSFSLQKPGVGLIKKIKSADSLGIARKGISTKHEDDEDDLIDPGSRKRYVSIMLD